MLSPEQCRAARGWLDWSQEDLASRANVGLSTVRDFEKGRRTPIANNLAALERALTEAGLRLRFRDDGTAKGVDGPKKKVAQPKQSDDPRKSDEGVQAARRFFQG
jgi:ribosome-binding protein aMBF1 (putative translation factor)